MVIVSGICAMLFSLQGMAAERMQIQVKQAQLRAQPSFLGKIEATLLYGDQVEVLEEQTDWSRVVVPETSISGWIHTSALTTKKLTLQAGSTETGTSSDELVLAGKGFNAQVEERYKQENQELNYARIDQMEREYLFSPQAIREFLLDGGLHMEGGAL
jgi:hypothetical protein